MPTETKSTSSGITKTCIGCDTEFTTTNLRKQRCKPNCKRKDSHAARNARTSGPGLEFISVDGEGVDRHDGTHDYIMLSVGDNTLTNPDGSALHHDDIFTFLMEAYDAHPNAAFIGFALGYDYTMWTRSFTAHEATMLYSREGIAARKRTGPNPEPFPVYVQSRTGTVLWEVDILAGKRFRLARHQCRSIRGIIDGRTYDHCNCGSPLRYPDWNDVDTSTVEAEWDDFTSKAKQSRRLYVCDTFGFWQSSFVDAINPDSWQGTTVVTPEQYKVISDGKLRRDNYTVAHGETGHLAEMAEYNRAENAVLSNLTATLNTGLNSINLNLGKKDWYGPGRAAQSWLGLVDRSLALLSDDPNSTDHTPLSRENHEARIPAEFRDIGRQSYYGGRFEQFIHGHVPGSVWEYDINSAYPAVIANLPCLLHGRWTQGMGGNGWMERRASAMDTPNALTVLYGVAHGSNPFVGPLPHRTRKGSIAYPSITRGWYWQHEVDAARNAGLLDTFDIEESVTYVPCDCEPPLDAIRDLYLARIDPSVGKNSPRGRALKLVYNSAYGKFAQSIGAPRYSNGIYASLITSGCRTQILDAIGSHPDGASAVTMIATDGIYFTTPHPSLDFTPNKLGAWEGAELTGMTQLMPGVYWTDKGRAAVRDNKKLKVKSRGISARDLSRSLDELDEAFTTFAENLDVWPTFKLNVAFGLVTAKQAVHRRAWNTAGKVLHNIERSIDSAPIHKRDASHPYRDGPYIRTAIRTLDTLDTVPYNRTFGALDPDEEQANTWGISPDGDLRTLVGWEAFQ
jgi:hypothetical protein